MVIINKDTPQQPYGPFKFDELIKEIAKEITQKDDYGNITIQIPATNDGESSQITFKMSDIKCMVPLN